MFGLITVNTETNTTEVSFAPYSVDQQISYLSMGYSPAIYIDEPEALYGQTCWEIDNYQEANTDLADELLDILAEIKEQPSYYDPETDTLDVVYSDLAIAKAYATECIEVYDNRTHYTRVVGFDNWSDKIKSGLLDLGYSPAISIGDPKITCFLPFTGETAWRLDSKL